MTKLGRGVNELQVDLLQGNTLGLHQQWLKRKWRDELANHSPLSLIYDVIISYMFTPANYCTAYSRSLTWCRFRGSDLLGEEANDQRWQTQLRRASLTHRAQHQTETKHRQTLAQDRTAWWRFVEESTTRAHEAWEHRQEERCAQRQARANAKQ